MHCISQLQGIIGVDNVTCRGRSSSLLDMRHGRSASLLRPPVQDQRASEDIIPSSSSSVKPEPVADSANIIVMT